MKDHTVINITRDADAIVKDLSTKSDLSKSAYATALINYAKEKRLLFKKEFRIETHG